MSWPPEPEFLTREIVDVIHEERIESFGGLHGVWDENGLEPAIGVAHRVTVSHRREPSLFRRQLADCRAIDCSRFPEQRIYEAMIQIATHEMSRADLAEYFRSALSPLNKRELPHDRQFCIVGGVNHAVAIHSNTSLAIPVLELLAASRTRLGGNTFQARNDTGDSVTR